MVLDFCFRDILNSFSEDFVFLGTTAVSSIASKPNARKSDRLAQVSIEYDLSKRL